jgi:hypothetical protein
MQVLTDLSLDSLSDSGAQVFASGIDGQYTTRSEVFEVVADCTLVHGASRGTALERNARTKRNRNTKHIHQKNIS